MIRVAIVTGALPNYVSDDSHSRRGAELIFHGRVRDREADQPIVALEYEQYEGMAEQELTRLAERTMREFPLEQLDCLHRIGMVPVGETSLRVVLWAKHRDVALTAMGWFITELKRTVPIWKWAISSSGRRFPA